MPSSCPTRFGYWLNSALFVGTHIKKISDFFKNIEFKKSAKILAILESERLTEEIKSLSRFKGLPAHIELLERQGLTVKEQLNIYCQVEATCKGTSFEKRFSVIRGKNKFLGLIEKKVLAPKTSRDSLYNFLPLNSMDVERSFSYYKILYSDRRRALKPNTINNIFQVRNKL